MDDRDIPEKSAGMVIIRPDENRGPCVLLLKIYSKYDLPKGHIEDSDAPEEAVSPYGQILNAAIRECREECGFQVTLEPDIMLDPSRQIARLIPGQTEPIRCVAYDKHTFLPRKIVYLFAAETLCHKAIIQKNKKSGIYEHQGYRWSTPENVSVSGLHRYLQSGVMKALELYEMNIKINEAVERINSMKEG